MNKKDVSRLHESSLSTQDDIKYRIALEDFYPRSLGSYVEKLETFTRFVPRPVIMRFLCRYEIFKKVLDVHGSVIECGVLLGSSLMAWSQFSAILEPINHQRKIIGFDTFSGFPSIVKEDETSKSEHAKVGGLNIDSYHDLQESIRLYNMNRPLGHIDKIKLVKGDIKDTVPSFLNENPQTVVSLLHLDVDVFEPTCITLEHFFPRIPKGGIIVFDELNADTFHGETMAVIKEFGLNKFRIQRIPFGSQISYAVIE